MKHLKLLFLLLGIVIPIALSATSGGNVPIISSSNPDTIKSDYTNTASKIDSNLNFDTSAQIANEPEAPQETVSNKSNFNTIVLIAVIAVLVFVVIYQQNFISHLKKSQFLLKAKEKGVHDEVYLKQLINLLPDFVYVKDRESKFVFANNELAKSFNMYSSDSFIGKTDYDFFDENLANQYFHDEQKIMKENTPIVNKVEPGNTNLKDKKWLSTTKVPILNKRKQVIGIIGLGRDITAYKEAEDKLIEQAENFKEINTLLEEKQEEVRIQTEIIQNEKNQLRTLIDNLPDIIYIKDSSARFITANKKLSNILKVDTIDDLMGKNDYDFYDKVLADKFYSDDMDVIASGNALLDKEEIGFNEAGIQGTFLTSKVPIRDENDQIIGLVGIGRDISTIKEAESKLKEQSEHLKEVNTILEERQEEIRIQSEHIELERNQLRTLIDNMPDSIYFKDAEARFIIANKSLTTHLKLTDPNGIIGKTDYDFFTKELADEYYYDDLNIIKSGSSIINKEEPGIDTKGKRIRKSTTKVAIKDADGNVIGLIGIGRDITKQKENEQRLQDQAESLKEMNVLLEERQEEIKVQSESIEQERNQLRTLIDNLPDLIYFKDENARFITGNRAIVRNMKSKSLANLIGKTDYDFYPRDLAEQFYQDDSRIIKSGEPLINQQERGIDEHGNKRIVYTSKVPVFNRDGKVIGIIGIGRDMTQQKESENKILEQSEYLREVNVLLEERQEEVQQQSEELTAQAEILQEANIELSKLNKTKDKFFSIIAHDLKNPFHAIMGFSELLTKEYSSMDDNQKKGLLELINVSSENAFNLLENLLQWARTQTDKIRYTPEILRIKNNIDMNIDFHKVSALKKQVHLESTINHQTIVFADNNMVNTIIRNLIGNALKFTDPQGSVTISTKNLMTRKGDEMLEISVTDTGIGIDKESLKQLFRIDSYYTTKGTSGESGTGLGLIICKEFVEKNGGEIKAISAPGKGSTFSFTLPVSEK